MKLTKKQDRALRDHMQLYRHLWMSKYVASAKIYHFSKLSHIEIDVIFRIPPKLMEYQKVYQAKTMSYTINTVFPILPHPTIEEICKVIGVDHEKRKTDEEIKTLVDYVVCMFKEVHDKERNWMLTACFVDIIEGNIQVT